MIWRDKAPQISGLLADLIDELMVFYPKNRPKNPEAILHAIAKIECPGAEGLSALPPTQLQGISPLNTERKWLKSLATMPESISRNWNKLFDIQTALFVRHTPYCKGLRQ